MCVCVCVLVCVCNKHLVAHQYNRITYTYNNNIAVY